MKNKTYTLNTLLAGVFGLELLVMVLLRAFAPNVILPEFDLIHLVTVSLAALVLDHYLAPEAKRCYICIPVFSAITFGLLPLAAQIVALESGLLLAVKGCAVFTATTWVYTSIQDRLSSGPSAKLAPVLSAIGLWLAVQAFAGIL